MDTITTMSHKANLILHCGSSRIERDALEVVPTPRATDTWQPIPHFELLTQIERALQSRDMEIVTQAHGLSRDGASYFGLLQVENETLGDKKDYGYVLGVRNNHTKRFPAGLAIGSSVFICDNLAFSSEITCFRRHTTHIYRDLPGIVARAVGQLSDRWGNQEARFEAYKGHELTSVEAHDLMIRALDVRAVTATQIPHILKEWRYPSHAEFAVDHTAWRLFNAVTEVAKDSGLWNLTPRTERLHGLLDQECGVTFSKN
jgi:Domain of unknown function (DUF932)